MRSKVCLIEYKIGRKEKTLRCEFLRMVLLRLIKEIKYKRLHCAASSYFANFISSSLSFVLLVGKALAVTQSTCFLRRFRQVAESLSKIIS